MEALIGSPDTSSAGAVNAALQEASIWQANAGTWAGRLVRQYEMYLDVVQPVNLAVQEARHGLALLSAAAALSSASTPSTDGSSGLVLPPQLQEIALASASALLSFPSSAPSPTTAGLDKGAPSAAHIHRRPRPPLPAVLVGEDLALTLVQGLASASARASAPTHLDLSQLSRIGETAGYSARLQALRVAMHAACRELLSSTRSTHPDETTTPSEDSARKLSSSLVRLEGLWAKLHGSWVQLKVYEEERAAEEAEIYKNRNRTTEIKSQEVRALTFCLCPTLSAF